MNIIDYLNFILPFVYVLVGICLIGALIAIIQLVITINKSLKPTLDDVQDMVQEIEPTIKKIDPIVSQVNPIMDRVTLTVDAANLEIMRLDGILEDVGNITNTAASAVSAVDKITNAPLNAIMDVSTMISGAFSGRANSPQTSQIAQDRASGAQTTTQQQSNQAQSQAQPPAQGTPSTSAPAQQKPAHAAPTESTPDQQKPAPSAQTTTSSQSETSAK